MSRIDVDTDPGTTRIIFKQHQRIGVEATYYFRLRTMDPSLMKAIADSGSEVGYHYEELATFAKRRGIRERDVILDHLEDIRSSFLENFVAFEKALGTKVKTVSAHGDFINRLVGLPNSIIIDETIKSKTKIRIDCDEPALTSSQ